MLSADSRYLPKEPYVYALASLSIGLVGRRRYVGLYDTIRHDVEFRKGSLKGGLGILNFQLKPVVGPNGPKIENEVEMEMS